ncbi:threonine/serine dehydratase [Streptomyces sp. NBC_00859]|uniref:threonine ammonia-lyase n=1 Tax=Streptomyces sp. NBC_00859 TaxID=2903682 RepID=UPI00386E17D7|nr:pyridoxal-phosphate dependent enzyme [Streptomyces sp. NBC_00859]
MPAHRSGGITGATLARLTRANVDRAQLRLTGKVLRTPVIRSDQLDASSGARLWLKAESLQRGGSFKVRGALLAVEALAAHGSLGVIAQSTGNHAIAVALAARTHKLPTFIVLPCDAPPSKVRRIKEAGGHITFAGTTLADRVVAVEELRRLHGYDVIDPYDNPHVVAGQATATAELLAQAASEGVRLDSVVVPIGGGSALAGACLAASGHGAAVIGAEPEAVPAFTEALRAGGPVTVQARPTIADGLRPDRIGALPYLIASRATSCVLTVPEEDIYAAMRAALIGARLLVEPAAATALAGALKYASGPGRNTDIGVLLSGGNVEQRLVADLLAEPDSSFREGLAS